MAASLGPGAPAPTLLLLLLPGVGAAVPQPGTNNVWERLGPDHPGAPSRAARPGRIGLAWPKAFVDGLESATSEPGLRSTGRPRVARQAPPGVATATEPTTSEVSPSGFVVAPSTTVDSLQPRARLPPPPAGAPPPARAPARSCRGCFRV